jgi:hypothetical protein
MHKTSTGVANCISCSDRQRAIAWELKQFSAKSVWRLASEHVFCYAENRWRHSRWRLCWWGRSGAQSAAAIWTMEAPQWPPPSMERAGSCGHFTSGQTSPLRAGQWGPAPHCPARLPAAPSPPLPAFHTRSIQPPIPVQRRTDVTFSRNIWNVPQSVIGEIFGHNRLRS